MANTTVTASSADPSHVGSKLRAETNHMVEWTLTAQKPCADPFNTLTVDAIFTTPKGRRLRVPAFWDGGSTWRVRYASGEVGDHRFTTECSDPTDAGLQGVTGYVKVTLYRGANPLYRHGPVHVSADKRHFEYADGSPFLWLGDTWWFGLCKRLSYPEDFQKLAADRKAKGFNVIQIVAGLYPEQAPLDPSSVNEGGLPWEPGFARIRPEYFDLADRRIQNLVDTGLMPCIVGAWGYYMPEMGSHKLEQQWRYIIARYGALPTVWCIAGEVNLPYYHAPNFPYDDIEQAHQWMDVVRYVREHDPYRRPLTVHPTGLGNLSARGTADAKLLDYDMLQTGHGGMNDLGVTVNTIHKSYTAAPTLPVVQGEVNYEALLGMDYNPDSIQRLFYWGCMLSGTTGYTYGGNGIWQVNLEGQPKITYGNYPVPAWQTAMNMPGSTEVGIAHKILMSYPWFRMAPHPEWAELKTEAPIELDGSHWIWYPEGNPAFDAPVAKRWFRRTFVIGAAKTVRSARLKMAADDMFTLWINGKPLGSHPNWWTGREFDELAPLLKSGENVVAVMAENGAANVPNNPASLIGKMLIEFTDGSSQTIQTDASWKTSKTQSEGWTAIGFLDGSWTSAMNTAAYGDSPWGKAARGGAALEPFCAGIPNELRIAYLPKCDALTLRDMEPGVTYSATWINPLTGRRTDAGSANGDANGLWVSPTPPAGPADRVLVLEREHQSVR